MRVRGLVVAVVIGVLATAAPSAGASVGVGHSGWYWGNPLPQGQSLAGLDFAGARGFAVGSFGTVLRSDDGGANWTGLGSGTTLDLTRVQALSANSVVIGGSCSLRRSDDGGATFVRLPFTTRDTGCPNSVAAFSFSSTAVGYIALDNGTVLRTADGGKSFSQRTGIPGTASTGGGANPTDIRFTGADTGVAVAGGKVFRTTDGANSWTAIPSAGSNVTAVRFLDAARGVAVGSGGTFLVTTDGGASFASRPLTGAGAGQQLTGVTCSDANTCVMTTGTTALVRTTDGGATSTVVSVSDGKIFGAAFSVAPRLAAVGDQGISVTSADAGATFSPVGTRFQGEFSGIQPAGGNRAYAPGTNGRVARTLDGGRTWSTFGVSTAGTIADVSFPTAASGFALDVDGALLRTDNAGDSWSLLDTGSPSKAKAVVAPDARHVVLIEPRGIRRSTNGGASFGASRSAAVRRAAFFDADQAGRSIVAYGDKALAISSDGGSRWRKLHRPAGTIADVDFVSAKRGFLLTRSGRVLTTASGGKHWSSLAGVGTSGVEGIAFADAKHGFADLDEGRVLRTADGGRSWSPQIVDSDGVIDVQPTTSKTAFALKEGSSHLFGTATGGLLGKPSTLSFHLSKRRLAKSGTVRLVGRLRPARSGAVVTISVQRGTRFSHTTATVASGGTFNARLRIAGTSNVVVQWPGDGLVDGDGTKATRVTVKHPTKHHKKAKGRKRR